MVQQQQQQQQRCSWLLVHITLCYTPPAINTLPFQRHDLPVAACWQA
jgi:hypothetical protein